MYYFPFSFKFHIFFKSFFFRLYFWPFFLLVCGFQAIRDFSVISFLLISLWSENTFYVTLILWNLLRFALEVSLSWYLYLESLAKHMLHCMVWVFYKYDLVLLVDDIVGIVCILAEFSVCCSNNYWDKGFKASKYNSGIIYYLSTSFCFIYFFSTECTFVIAYVD